MPCKCTELSERITVLESALKEAIAYASGSANEFLVMNWEALLSTQDTCVHRYGDDDLCRACGKPSRFAKKVSSNDNETKETE